MKTGRPVRVRGYDAIKRERAILSRLLRSIRIDTRFSAEQIESAERCITELIQLLDFLAA